MRQINTLWHICCNCFPHNELTWSSHRWICIWMCICSNWLLGPHYYCINITNDTMCVEICSRWFVLQVICNTSFVSYRKIDVLKCNVTHRVQWFDQWWETSNQPHKSSSFLVFFLEIAPIYVAWQMCPTTSVLNEPRTKKRFPEYAKHYRVGEKVEKTRNPTFCILRSLWACWAAFCFQWSTWSGWPVTIVGPERNFFVCFVRFLHLTAGQWQAGDHKKHTMQIGYNTIQIRYLFTQFGSTKWNQSIYPSIEGFEVFKWGKWNKNTSTYNTTL